MSKPRTWNPDKMSQKEKDKLLSKVWRISNLYQITDKNANLLTFIPNPAQGDFLKNKSNRNIILKSRQLGFTTFSVINMLDNVLWNPNFKALLIAHEKEAAIEIFDDKVMLAWELYEPYLKEMFEVDTERANKLKLGFSNGKYSEISVRISGRSGTFQHIHVSEFGKICAKYPSKATEIISGSFKAAPLDGEITVESTAEGDSGRFYNMFWDAWNRQKRQGNDKKLPTEYKAFFYSWLWDVDEIAKVTTIIPTTQMDDHERFEEVQKKHNLNPQQLSYYYLQWIQMEKDWNLLHQEMPLTPEEAFVSSGSKLFDVEKVNKLHKYIKKPIDQIGSWTIYENKQAGHDYVLSVDPAGGDGKHHSAMVIIDFTPLRPKIVATYQNNRIKPDILSHEAVSMAKLYNNPLIAVERNNHGFSTITNLKDIYPPELIYKQVNEEYEEDKETEKLGWYTSKGNKPAMMYALVRAVNDDHINIPDETIHHEMRSYNRDDLSTIVYKNDNMTAHSDLLMALAIGWQMREQVLIASTEVKTYNVHDN